MTSTPLKPVEDPAPAPEPSRRVFSPPPAEEIAAWTIVAAALVFVLFEHLVPALVAGLALYLILDSTSKALSRRLSGDTARPLALLVVIVVSASAVAGLVALAIWIVRHSAGRIPEMMNQMANILVSTRAWLGDFGDFIPDVLTDADNLKLAVAEWLKGHAQAVRAAGGYLSLGVIRLFFGMLLAVLVFLRHATYQVSGTRRPLARALAEKVQRFAETFSQIASAQVKISAVNTTLTAIYLLVLLPLFGHHLRFTTTLIVITFIAGLIPVVGNLLSNTVITILSLGISVGTAVASLVFLILIHKLEYITNSRIVGGETDSRAWEILLAIIVGETAFGISGIVMGPIIYAYVKRELRDQDLV